MSLVACPFCREMFEEGEAVQCPVCGMALTKFEKLPPSVEATDDGVAVDPGLENFPFTYLGRNRGVLLALAVVGFALFFLPWATKNVAGDATVLTGIDVARELSFPWLGCVAWFVMIPTVLSRRSIFKMRGARVAAASLAAMPSIIVASLLVHRPEKSLLLTVDYQWPLYASLAVSIVAAAVALGFGGRVDVIKVKKGSSAGHIVH